MLINKDSSVGIVEDLLTSIMNQVASEYHLQILVRKYEDQLKYWYSSEALDAQEAQEINKVEQAVFNTDSLLKQVTEQRRASMKQLKKQATEKGNPDAWCLLKHVLVSTITAFEMWQVNLGDMVVRELFLEQSRILNQVVAMFLGYEVTPCSACLTDQLEKDNK